MSEEYPPFYEGDRARYRGPPRMDLQHGHEVTITGCRRLASDKWEAMIRTNRGRLSVDADYLDLIP